MSNPRALPPASTTRVDLRSQATGFFAQRRRQVSQERPPASESTDELDRIVRQAYAEEADSASPAPSPGSSGPPSGALPERRYRLSELAEAVKARRARRKAAVEARDPDGPDDGGWDPQPVLGEGGALLAAQALRRGAR